MTPSAKIVCRWQLNKHKQFFANAWNHNPDFNQIACMNDFRSQVYFLLQGRMGEEKWWNFLLQRITKYILVNFRGGQCYPFWLQACLIASRASSAVWSKWGEAVFSRYRDRQAWFLYTLTGLCLTHQYAWTLETVMHCPCLLAPRNCSKKLSIVAKFRTYAPCPTRDTIKQ